MPESHPKEVQTILNKARHYGMEAEFDENAEEGFTRLIVSGAALSLFQESGHSWAPNVTIQGNAGIGKLAFLWSNSRIQPPKTISTKPTGSLPDEDVLDAVPQSQILTEHRLREVLANISEKIEAAYPGVSISDEGFGKGKMDLLLLVHDRLYSIATRNLSRYMSICVVGLLPHMQSKGDLPEHVSLPKSPVAIARR